MQNKIIDMDKLNQIVTDINMTFKSDGLNLLEKKLVVDMLTEIRQKEIQTLAAKDQMNSILPPWIAKYMNRKTDPSEDE